MGKHRRTLSLEEKSARLRRAAVALGAAGLVLIGVSFWGTWTAYRDIERVAFSPAAEAAEQMATIPLEERQELRAEEEAAEEAAWLVEAQELEDEVLAELEERREQYDLQPDEAVEYPFVSSPPLPDEMFTSYLLVGVERQYRADAIILILLPRDGPPMMTSLPRDLYIFNPCTQRYTRINAGLGGCKGYASGAELLSLMVADYTGIEIDHFARVDFDGFQEVINALGGVDICVENAVRDDQSLLDLPAGCSRADGFQALAWVRSRRTEELVDGTWQKVAGVSDFTRQRKQQDMLFKIAGKLNSFASFASFSEVAQSLADTVTLDEGFSFGDAVSLAWSLRGLQASDVLRVSVSVRDYVTSGGAWVLLPTASYNERLAKYYPAAGR